MRFKDVLQINMYAQGLVDNDSFNVMFATFDLMQKREYLSCLLSYIGQSKPIDDDIPEVIKESRLKSTFTPCILLKKGVQYHHLLKTVELPEYELNKTLVLLLTLFKIAYLRRFKLEGNGDKWWYWDFSNPDNVNRAINLNSV